MLTFEDCVALSDLSESEVSAVAQSEGLPAVSAAGYAGDLYETATGRDRLRRIYTERQADAASHGDTNTVDAMTAALSRLDAMDHSSGM